MSLFADRAAAVASIRTDRLLLVGASLLPGVGSLSDDYIWDKLLSSEASAQRELRCYFMPTKIVPYEATQEELDALEASGEPWAQEAAYDYDTDFFQGDRWGYIVAQSKPVQSVESVIFSYPSALNKVFEIPTDWIRIDKRMGHIRFVPTSVSVSASISAYVMQAFGGSRSIPFMIQMRYTAGLKDAATKWPDLVDLVKKKAVLSIISDAFLPQSGSISADGLSQSLSVDMSKYHEAIDMMMNGPKGSNGGLMAAIHGIRVGVL